MKVPRDCSGADLVRALRRLGYETRRQTGPHIRLTTTQGGEHHLTVPHHDPLKVGLLLSLLKDVASHHHSTVEQLVQELGL